MARTTYNNKSCYTTDCTRDCHGTDNNFLYMDTGIFCSILTLTNYSDLITLFAVFQINEHPNSQNQNDQNIPAVFLSKQFRQPACLCCLINDTNSIGTFWIFPENDTICNHLHGNIIQHQSKKCFICIPVCFEYRRDHTPYHAAKCTCNKHNNK